MENRKRDKEITALVLIDPNSDFISSFPCGRECSLLPLSLATRSRW
jgi:hypothetical protein